MSTLRLAREGIKQESWKKEGMNAQMKCAFGSKLKNQLILLFSLFLLLFIGSTTLFSTIHRSHCTISANFYLYLQYFQQKVFSFSKISESQTDPKLHNIIEKFSIEILLNQEILK